MQCFKCKAAVAIVASREGAKKSYCVECLVDLVTRSVRDCFFRNCRVPPSPIPIILAVSGGFSSMAMMEALGVLRVQNAQRGGAGKILFNFHILHLAEMEEEGGGADDDTNNTLGNYGAAKKIIQLAATGVDTTIFEKNNKKKQKAAAKKLLEDGADTTSKKPDDAVSSPPPTSTATPLPSLFPPENVHIRSMRQYCAYPFWGGGGGGVNNAASPSSTATAPPLSTTEDIYFQARRNAILTAASEIAQREISNHNNNSLVVGSGDGNGGSSPISDAYVLFGDHAVSCAVTALDCTVRGRGANIVDLCGYSGHLHWRSPVVPSPSPSTTTNNDDGAAAISPTSSAPYLHVRRPMRDLLPKELIQYCRAQNIAWTGSILSFQHQQQSTSTPSSTSSSASASKKFVYAPSPLTKIPTGKSVYRTLEQFVLALCEGGTYRSTVFNILNAVEKLAAAYTEELGSIAAKKQKSEIQQKRFGPKNAAVFGGGDAAGGGGEPGMPAVRYGLSIETIKGTAAGGKAPLEACLLCGGMMLVDDDGEIVNSDSAESESKKKVGGGLTFCRACNHALKRIGVDSATGLVSSLLSYSPQQHGEGLRKMSEEEMKDELAEFLIDDL